MRPHAAKIRLGLEGKVVLGFTGFVSDWHGLDVIIDGLGRPRFSRSASCCCRRRARDTCAQGASGKTWRFEPVLFAGLVDRDRVGDFVAVLRYRACSPKRRIRLSAEALRIHGAGKAIVAPDQPNIREVLEDEKTALLFDPADTAGMFAAVKRLIDDPDSCASVSERLRRNRYGARLHVAAERGARRGIGSKSS